MSVLTTNESLNSSTVPGTQQVLYKFWLKSIEWMSNLLQVIYVNQDPDSTLSCFRNPLDTSNDSYFLPHLYSKMVNQTILHIVCSSMNVSVLWDNHFSSPRPDGRVVSL